MTSRRPSGLRKTRNLLNSLAHKTTWLRSDLYGHGKQCVVVIPDDEIHEPLNLMVACGTTRIIKLSELATFDFRHVVADVYDGEVY